MIQLDGVTRIKLALRNQGQLAPFVCYLVSKIGNFAINIIESICAKKILSNCRKQLFNTSQFDKKKYFNLTCLSLTTYLFSKIGSSLPKLKTDFFRSHFDHCVIIQENSHQNLDFQHFFQAPEIFMLGMSH